MFGFYRSIGRMAAFSLTIIVLGGITAGGASAEVAFDPSDSKRLYAATSKGVWTMADVTSGSDTWVRVGTGSFTLLDGTVVTLEPEVRSIALDASGTLYMATWGFGVLTNAAPNAATASTQIALKGANVSVVAVSPSGSVVAGTADGVQTIVAASSTAQEPDLEIPTSYSLHQNYPNPFNPTTSITFDLPHKGQVSLTVIDVLGREVSELAKGEFAAGTHAITLDASRLQSGLYIYRLDAGGRVLARTMSLVK